MAHDLFFRRSSRNWSRGGDAPAKNPAATISGSAALKRAALGTMALGTFAGLAFITSPWWRPAPKPPVPRHDLMRRRLYLPAQSPSTRIVWSKR